MDNKNYIRHPHKGYGNPNKSYWNTPKYYEPLTGDYVILHDSVNSDSVFNYIKILYYDGKYREVIDIDGVLQTIDYKPFVVIDVYFSGESVTIENCFGQTGDIRVVDLVLISRLITRENIIMFPQ